METDYIKNRTTFFLISRFFYYYDNGEFYLNCIEFYKDRHLNFTKEFNYSTIFKEKFLLFLGNPIREFLLVEKNDLNYFLLTTYKSERFYDLDEHLYKPLKFYGCVR